MWRCNLQKPVTVKHHLKYIVGHWSISLKMACLVSFDSTCQLLKDTSQYCHERVPSSVVEGCAVEIRLCTSIWNYKAARSFNGWWIICCEAQICTRSGSQDTHEIVHGKFLKKVQNWFHCKHVFEGRSCHAKTTSKSVCWRTSWALP